MPVIDADAHVIETNHTWDFLEGSDKKYRPFLAVSPTDSNNECWIIDGQVRGSRFPSLSERELEAQSKLAQRHMETPRAARELDDVDLRLRHMDELGIDVQVLHTTIFLQQAADRPEVEVALCKSYNRWLADVWERSGGRLRWSCVLPLLSMPHALEEMAFAKEHGAVGVLIRAIEGERVMLDPYFFPVYEEASRLNMAVVVHISSGNPWLSKVLGLPYEPGAAALIKFRSLTVGACAALTVSSLPARFPDLRWGFIEATSQWVPWIYKDAERRFQTAGREFPRDLFSAFKLYVSCETDDDLEYVLKYSGEDSLVIGTDYGHTDAASEVDAITTLKTRTDISPTALRKILDDNPRALYGL